jgi:hypothetical protein
MHEVLAKQLDIVNLVKPSFAFLPEVMNQVSNLFETLIRHA